MYRNIKKIVTLAFLIILCLIFPQNSSGQLNAKGNKETGGMGYSIFGRSIINLSELNSDLETIGYPAFSENFFSVGGGGHTIINNRFILGGEGQSLLGDSQTAGSYNSSIIMGYGFFNFGYSIFSIKDFRVYPLVGIGAGGIKLKLTEDISSVSFYDVLGYPARSSVLSTGGLLLNFSIGTEYLLKFAEDEKSRGGFYLGVRGGYTVSPFKGEWSMDGIEVTGSPKMGITGPYVKILIGGGAYSK